MAKDVHPPRGMRDFLPVEKSHRDQILTQIRETYLSHGFQEIETPALEDLARLTSGQGGDNEKLAFRVMKRGEELERSLNSSSNSTDGLADLGLRYDLTVPLTRYYATNRAKLPTVFKALQTGPVWRAERPQKGRYRQFVQCDIDIIGDASIIAEIELLNASLDALQNIGLGEARIRINHRVLLEGFSQAAQIPEAKRQSALVELDKLDKQPLEEVKAKLSNLSQDQRALASAIATQIRPALEIQKHFAEQLSEQWKLLQLQVGSSMAREISQRINSIFAAQAEESFRSLLNLSLKNLASERPARPNQPEEGLDYVQDERTLPASRITSADDAISDILVIKEAIEARHGKGKLRFDPTLVRGMGYYTGPIFEIEHPDSGSSIGGGGRYDGMVGRWLGQDAPAVGISIGFERAVDLVEASTEPNAKALVLVLNSNSPVCVAAALNAQAEAIALGYRVRLEQRPKKLGNLLEVMQQQGFGIWAQIGEEPVAFVDLELKPLSA